MRRRSRPFAPRRLARAIAACAIAGVLAGCPEERPGATREISPQKFPPAMPVEQPPLGPMRRAEGTPPAAERPPQATPGVAAPRPAPDRSDATR